MVVHRKRCARYKREAASGMRAITAKAFRGLQEEGRPDPQNQHAHLVQPVAA